MDTETMRQYFPVHEADTQDYASLKKDGFKFSIRSYTADGLGGVATIESRGMGGLLRKTIFAVAPISRDLPLFWSERIDSPLRHVAFIEFWDTCIDQANLARLNNWAERCGADAWPDGRPLGGYPGKRLTALSRVKTAGSSGRRRFDVFLDRVTEDFFRVAKDMQPCGSEIQKTRITRLVLDEAFANEALSTNTFGELLGKGKARSFFENVLFRLPAET